MRTIIVAASGWRGKRGLAGLGRWIGCPGPEPVDGRGCDMEAQDVRVDNVPGLGPVDAGPRLAGIRGRSQGKGQTLTSELGTDHFDPILDEPNLVLHPGDDHALEPGECEDARSQLPGVGI